MKKAMVLAILFFIMTGLTIVQAECIRKARGEVQAHITYKEKNRNAIRKDVVSLELYIEAEGRYGGDCNKNGRRKSKERAAKMVHQMIAEKYFQKGDTLRSRVCELLQKKIRDNHDWIKVDYLKRITFVNRKVYSQTKIESAAREKFRCQNKRPVKLN
ncbi:MAG: hypothetical protein HUK40_06960 [Desulfobacter sp.]|nr:hypothetical protein [Desulfobacter sp.]